MSIGPLLPIITLAHSEGAFISFLLRAVLASWGVLVFYVLHTRDREKPRFVVNRSQLIGIK